MKKTYIAYGSNLDLWQMQRRCPTSRPIGRGILKGWRLVFKGSRTGSYLTIVKDPDGEVPVGLFEVRKEDELALDRYEGCPFFYQKIRQSVHTPDGVKTGFVYLMPEDAKYGIPSEVYMLTCMEGYDDFGFDHKYLQEALKESEERYGKR